LNPINKYYYRIAMSSFSKAGMVPTRKPSNKHKGGRRVSCSDERQEDTSIYETDDFKIWCMKVIPCTKRFVHDWTVCPFAHTGEKAARRDPRKYQYTGIACPDMKGCGECVRGDACPYAHNVFEYWLHPTRYRTQLCKDGALCKRSICFFAHDLEQLRVPEEKPYISPEQLASSSLMGIRNSLQKVRTQGSEGGTPPRVSKDYSKRESFEDSSLVWTPQSIYSTGDVTPRGQQPCPVRSSAPNTNMDTARAVHGTRKSSDDVYASRFPYSTSDLYSPSEVRQHEGHSHDMGLAEALAALSMNLQHQAGGSAETNRDNVLQTVHQVLKHALESKESSLLSQEESADVPSEGPESQRNSSDIDTPKYGSFPGHIDPWKHDVRRESYGTTLPMYNHITGLGPSSLG
jgi:hypothetical protein